MNRIPIIRLEVEGMRHTVAAMLTEHAAKMDADIQAAVDEYCTDGNLARVVRSAARQAIEDAVKEEVRNFFSWSNTGRMAIREAVHKHLEEQYGQLAQAQEGK